MDLSQHTLSSRRDKISFGVRPCGGPVLSGHAGLVPLLHHVRRSSMVDHLSLSICQPANLKGLTKVGTFSFPILSYPILSYPIIPQVGA